MRVRARKDANHSAIVAAFRAMHCDVMDTASLGKGIPDLVVSCPSPNGYVTLLVEVKDGNKPPSQRKLTKYELEFMHNWRGLYVIIESVDDIIALLKRLT